MSRVSLPVSVFQPPQRSRGDSKICRNHPFPSLARPGKPALLWLPGLIALLLMTAAIQVVAANPPDLHADLQLDDTRPFAQQTVMLRLRVTHSPAVTELNVDPVQATDFMLKPMASPPRTTHMSGPQQLTSDFVYALTPLSSGTLHLPPMTVRARLDSATPANAQTSLREISASSEPLTLDVRALPDDAKALLPLHALDMTLQYDKRQRLQVGVPIEVSIVQNAAGGMGERLNSVTALIKSDDFRVYPGKSETSNRLMRNGQLLLGQRVDTLSVVPLHDGRLQLPAISQSWWDIGRGRTAQAGWPGETLEIWPEPGAVTAPATVPPQPDMTVASRVGMAPPWQVVIGMISAFAVGWWLRGRCIRGETARTLNPPGMFGLLAQLRKWMLKAGRHGTAYCMAVPGRLRRGQRTAATLSRAMLHRQTQTIGRIAARLPDPWAIAHETDHLRQAVEAAPDADALRQCLLGWGNKILGLPIHATLDEWGRTLVRSYPQVDGERINHLLAELDASLYGGARILELEAWKQSFRTELDRIGGRKPFHAAPVRYTGLPVLNPV